MGQIWLSVIITPMPIHTFVEGCPDSPIYCIPQSLHCRKYMGDEIHLMFECFKFVNVRKLYTQAKYRKRQIL